MPGVTNARIWTADTARPWIDAFDVHGGRFVEPTAIDRTRIDAAGRVVVPGLIDSHTHLLMGGRTMTQLDLSRVTGRASFEQAVAEHHRTLPPGVWLIGNGWSNEAWSDSTLPDRTWLAAAEDRPAVCYRVDIHAVLVNDVVLAMLDLETDPPVGRVVRDANGAPTGLLLEAAAWDLVNPLVPAGTISEQRTALIEAQRVHHAVGITSVGTMELAAAVDSVYRPMRDQLTMRCRITVLDCAWPMDMSFGSSFANDEHLAVIGYKAFLDGTLGSRTARFLDDYADDAGNRGEFLELALSDDVMAWARCVVQSGLSPSMHAIGDAAVRLALDVAECMGPDGHVRIEHAQHVRPEDVPRFQGVIASMQPLHKADDARFARARLGDQRMSSFFPMATLQRAGAVLAFGSDWPVVSFDPRLGIRTAVTGLCADGAVCMADENLSVEAALVAYTRDAARCLRMENAGIIRPGALADFVVFDDDPFAWDWTSGVPAIAMTAVGGEIVYDARSSDSKE